MSRKILGASALAVVILATEVAMSTAYAAGKMGQSLEAQLPSIREEAALQNEKAIGIPDPIPRITSSFNKNKNVYFGDTHVHTALSFDSYLSGNRLSLRDAYRFANGEPLTMITGETMQLTRPLDFVVMADHAEAFGLFVTCGRPSLTERQIAFCKGFDTPSIQFYQRLRAEGEARPPVRSSDLCDDDIDGCLDDAKITWKEIRDTADEFNRPGVFTAFAGYEYSPPLPKKGKIHRNVIFRNSDTPDRAVSAFDAVTVLDLWRSLERECKGECEFFTIPHNMNKTWGIAYSGKTIDGDNYTRDDWALRGRSEPLAEIFQAKGSSECGFGVGASDEECNFELIVPICEGEQVPGCSGRTSFAREGLKIGLNLEQQFGFNPLQFGFVGSTDTHNSNPGDTEEYDWRGATMLSESPARKRLDLGSANKTFTKVAATTKNPGGLAAVWARENTRDAIFDSMRSRETYATSGTRIKLRFFAGWNFSNELLDDVNLISKAYQGGIPMGSVLDNVDGKKGSPEFVVWVAKDPLATNLQKVQMIKAWTEAGVAKEQVVDIACSGKLKPDAKTHRCPDNGATVNISTCAVSADIGDTELKVSWRDPQFNPQQSAVYYVRVLENPSCRWSSYDAIRLDVSPPKDVPATIQERAWSSPIWYTP